MLVIIVSGYNYFIITFGYINFIKLYKIVS